MEAYLMVTCPYNPSHRIRKYKFMNHVAKCKKTASKTENKVECPLDRTHIVDRDDLKEHIKSCTSIGKLVDLNTELEPKDVESSITVNSYNTENWEEEPEVPSYDPMEASAKKPVIRCVSGLTKSEKKKFKENERMRIANLKGFHSASAASSSLRDTVQEVQEVPLRPPRNIPHIISSTRVSQDNFDKTTQMQDHDDHNDHGASAQASFVPKFHNNTFHRMLYDELAPEDDSIEQLEQSLRNTDPVSVKDYFQHMTNENGNFSISDRNQETKVKKSEIDETSEPFTVDNTKKREDECNMSTSNVSSVRVNELLTLLKGESSIEKVQPVKNTTKNDQISKNSGEKGSTSAELFKQFNERLAYLRDIQNTAAEESARLFEQLKELKLYEEMVFKE